MSRVIDSIADIYDAEGLEPYGEQVSMRDHMLLTAQRAVEEGASDELVAACLLHDVGHLLVSPDDEFGKHTHDEIGADWLTQHFPPAVSEPVRKHVEAKRYLCATDPAYHAKLSPASQYTLAKQGGPMSPGEIEQFEQEAYFEDALRLRRWEDEYGKLAGTRPPDFDEFRPILERLIS